MLNKDKNSAKNLKKYINKYLEESCEGKQLKLTALTGFNISAAGKFSDTEYYNQKIKCIACIEDKKVVNKEIILMCFLDKNSQILHFEDLTAYEFVVKKIKHRNKELYYIIKNKGKSKTKLFNSIIEEESKPVIIKEEDIVFKFNKQIKIFEGNVNIENKNIHTLLFPNADTKDVSVSLNTFRKIKNNFNEFVNTVLVNASKEAFIMANAWKEDSEKEITKLEIYEILKQSSFELEIREKDFTIYFNYLDLFYGHSLLYNGNIESDEFDTIIAG